MVLRGTAMVLPFVLLFSRGGVSAVTLSEGGGSPPDVQPATITAAATIPATNRIFGIRVISLAPLRGSLLFAALILNC